MRAAAGCLALGAVGVLAGNPRLERFKVFGLLPSGKSLQVPFDPPFHSEGNASDYVCKLDTAMEYFTLIVDSRAPGVLSVLERDGEPVLSRLDLTRAKMAAGERTVFSAAVTDGDERKYTLVVERRQGTSLELLGLRPLTAIGGKFTVPYHAGELQGDFEAEQSLEEDIFEVEYDFADGGQQIECRVDDRKTIGPDAPTGGMMAMRPHKYLPALEQLWHVREDRIFNLNSPGAGPTARCQVPIDTWRQIVVGIHIKAADGVSRRSISIVVTRKGCDPATFYHKGTCHDHCPTYHYEQRFNWRCGACNRHCEFCEHWHHCVRCQRNTTVYKYVQRDDGTCQQRRVHAYRVYYDLARYLAISCAAILALYGAIFAGCLCCGACRPGAGGRRGGRPPAAASELEPLTGRRRFAEPAE